MSELHERVKSVANICAIYFAFTGQLLPSTIEGYQIFSNSIPSGTDFQKFYASKASVRFSEESDTGNPGTSYRQKLVISFPSTDSRRAERLELMGKVKFIKIELTNKKSLVLGRNDFNQNARPKHKIKSEEKLTQVEFETLSISPCGYMPSMNSFGLPTLFPISFINTDE